MKDFIQWLFMMIGVGFTVSVICIFVKESIDNLKIKLTLRCPNCGKRYKSRDHYCSKCGKNLR